MESGFHKTIRATASRYGTQCEAAKALGVSESSLSRWLRGGEPAYGLAMRVLDTIKRLERKAVKK